MTIRLAGFVEESVVDGKGIRFAIFVQGCPHRCYGCHNPQTHDLSGGEDVALSELFAKIKANPLLQGVTFSGGEPFLYPMELAKICDFVKGLGLDVWCYTGYTLEQLREMALTNTNIAAFLKKIDVLVDGQYIEGERDLLLKFKGSKNQRMIDLKAMNGDFNAKIVELKL